MQVKLQIVRWKYTLIDQDQLKYGFFLKSEIGWIYVPKDDSKTANFRFGAVDAGVSHWP